MDDKSFSKLFTKIYCEPKVIFQKHLALNQGVGKYSVLETPVARWACAILSAILYLFGMVTIHELANP